MRKQQGAALMVVLALLVASLMLGLSSVQLALIDERLAGNYKAAAQAQMGAEHAASHAFLALESDTEFNAKDPSGLSWEGFYNLSSAYLGTEAAVCVDPVKCFYYYWRDGEDEFIVAMGAVVTGGEAIARSEQVMISLGTTVRSPFVSGITGCEGVTINGGGSVSSYDSSKGAWGAPKQSPDRDRVVINTEIEEKVFE